MVLASVNTFLGICVRLYPSVSVCVRLCLSVSACVCVVCLCLSVSAYLVSVGLSVRSSVCLSDRLSCCQARALTGVRVNRSGWNFRGMFGYIGRCAVLFFEAIRQHVYKII